MNEQLKLVLELVRRSLRVRKNITRDEIRKMIESFAYGISHVLEEDEIRKVVKIIEEETQWTMGLGSTITDNSEHKKWLLQNRQNIDWYYWERYKKQLIEDGFGTNVVDTMDEVTDDILNLLQNPKDKNSWSRKGLVVGHVQSGKTANYSAVVCKALDSGYRVVIILAGLLNSLRKQTQERADYGIIGTDSRLELFNKPIQERLIGVGNIDFKSRPISITTADSDFSKSIAMKRQVEIEQYSRPIIFIVKKNVSILKNLIDWLKTNNLDLSKYPMLLIDDEADHASINTKKEDYDPTKTNDRIRDLLSIFPKNNYLGYTATPFANIFINPDTPEDMVNDLFPENFIKTLDAPSNYFGSEKIFLDKKSNPIKDIDDYQDLLPFNHKITHVINHLPESLKEAVRRFFIVCAIRYLRGQVSKSNSMLINISRFTNIQTQTKHLVDSYFKQIRNSVHNYSSLSQEDALRDPNIKALFKTWSNEFKIEEFLWLDVQNKLNAAISRVEVVEVNGSKNGLKAIDYSERNYPEGRHIIAIGGLSLSRGITLEGLSTSYILRNSKMYDTLMQMGRWFGYRPGYEDLCSIYMTKDSADWYEHIAKATNELRLEFKKMERLQNEGLDITPMDFGLAVRNHPDSLIVTARNKMRTAKTITRTINIAGLNETIVLYNSKKKIHHNLKLADKLYKDLQEYPKAKVTGNDIFWEDIPYKHIINFVQYFENHPESTRTDSGSLKNYIYQLADEKNIDKWNVLFANPNSPYEIKIEQEHLKKISAGVRRETRYIIGGIKFDSSRVSPEKIEFKDLDDPNEREIPLLIIHLLDCRNHKDKEATLFKNGVIAYGIMFPYSTRKKETKTLVSFQANTIWWKKNYLDDQETDEDLVGEI